MSETVSTGRGRTECDGFNGGYSKSNAISLIVRTDCDMRFVSPISMFGEEKEVWIRGGGHHGEGKRSSVVSLKSEWV